MLLYLDNWLSAAPQTAADGPFARFACHRRKNGLNENYARGLMELHTLGIDGGYTQKDVTEVARVFTGWTLDFRDVLAEALVRHTSAAPIRRRCSRRSGSRARPRSNTSPEGAE